MEKSISGLIEINVLPMIFGSTEFWNFPGKHSPGPSFENNKTLSDGPIYLGTSMITDGIGQHKVLLLINHNHNKICDILGWKF